MRRRHVIIASTAALGVGVVLGVGCSEYNDERGRGDAPIGKFNDSPAYVVNMPDQFHNIAIRCVGGNGIYAHTREAAPTVIVDDPLCAEGGFIDQLGLEQRADQSP
ncbi:MAG: hypothetical protein MUF83_17720 [Acidimicrobiales bacterium]|jgi:hypothetical protein|nr:hypothetical protein [Acidimicrobiales bacterium]